MLLVLSSWCPLRLSILTSTECLTSVIAQVCFPIQYVGRSEFCREEGASLL
jgi:hypothetical protein